MNNKLMNVLPPIVDNNTRVLIVGSMPGQQSLEKKQYYGNPRNHFWSIIATILNVQPIPERYEERLKLLTEHRIGVWDAIQSCERVGSLDATIRNEQSNDFYRLFKCYPHIQMVLFNGGKAHDVFKKYIGFDVLKDRQYAKMPSTSPIPGKNIKTFEEKVETWRILLNYIDL